MNSMSGSDAILEEIERVLRTKFKWEPEAIQEIETLIRSVAKHVDPKLRLDVVPDDPDDNRIVECAVEAGSEVIIANDKDLLRTLPAVLGLIRSCSARARTLAGIPESLILDSEQG